MTLLDELLDLVNRRLERLAELPFAAPELRPLKAMAIRRIEHHIMVLIETIQWVDG